MKVRSSFIFDRCDALGYTSMLVGNEESCLKLNCTELSILCCDRFVEIVCVIFYYFLFCVRDIEFPTASVNRPSEVQLDLMRKELEWRA